MHVTVDSAGQDKPAGGVQLLPSMIERVAERDDAAVPDADVGREAVRRGHHGSPSDDEIEAAHVCNLPVGSPATALGRRRCGDRRQASTRRSSFSRMCSPAMIGAYFGGLAES